MKKILTSLMLTLSVISSSAMASGPAAFFAEHYARNVDGFGHIVVMLKDGTQTNEQAMLSARMQLNVLRQLALTDGAMNGKRAQFKAADVDCFVAESLAMLKAGTTTFEQVYTEYREAYLDGKFRSCAAGNNGSERGR